MRFFDRSEYQASGNFRILQDTGLEIRFAGVITFGASYEGYDRHDHDRRILERYSRARPEIRVEVLSDIDIQIPLPKPPKRKPSIWDSCMDLRAPSLGAFAWLDVWQ